MTLTVRAPVRIDFAGGWSDVPEYADAFEGAVVNAAISRYAEVRVRPLDRHVRLVAEDLDDTFECKPGDPLRFDGCLDLHKAALQLLSVRGGVEVISGTQVPPGSGLGASGALDVALVAALREMNSDGIADVEEVAELAFQLEAVHLGLTGGRQDQYAAALGGFLRLGFSRHEVTVTRVRPPRHNVLELESALVIGYTGQTHFSSNTHNRVWHRFRRGETDVIDAIHSMKSLVDPVVDAIVQGDWRTLARLVDENWKHQQRLHDSIATPATRATEAAARHAGAWGVKAAGAGAGGCMLFIGPPDRREHISEAIRRAGGTILDYTFETEGVRVVT